MLRVVFGLEFRRWSPLWRGFKGKIGQRVRGTQRGARGTGRDKGGGLGEVDSTGMGQSRQIDERSNLGLPSRPKVS